MKKNRTMIAAFLIPALLTFGIAFLYPVVRTIIMSFFSMDSVTAGSDEWVFVGLANYQRIWSTDIFLTSLLNILKIWVVGGIIVLSISLMFAIILTSGVRFKSFFRAAIYLPNIISAVALATMWIQYVFNVKYGLIHRMFEALGAVELANVNWLGSDMKFWAMLVAYCFGAVGYYMLIFLSGIERIPGDLYEAATIDGAGKLRQFFSITLPLLKGVIKTNLTFWSVHTITFYIWSKMFSPIESESSTITPIVYMMNIVFGSKGITDRDAGRGAAIGVSMAILVLIAFFLFNKLIKEEEVEY